MIEKKPTGKPIRIDADFWRELNEIERATRYRAELAIENIKDGKRTEAEHLIEELLDHQRQSHRQLFIKVTAP